MNDKLYEKEINYRLSLLLAHSLLEQGHLDLKELLAVHKKLLKHYRPPIGELCEASEASTKGEHLWKE